MPLHHEPLRFNLYRDTTGSLNAVGPIPPTLLELPDQSLKLGDTLTFTYSDYSYNADQFTVDGETGNGELVFSPDTTGDYSFTIRAINTRTSMFHERDLEVSVTNKFDWTMEENVAVVRGGDVVVFTIGWEQGDTEIEDFGLDNIEILFFSDEAKTLSIEDGDSEFSIGDEDLDDIITLENFVDNGDDTGSVDVRVDPSGITAMELMTERNVYFVLRAID